MHAANLVSLGIWLTVNLAFCTSLFSKTHCFCSGEIWGGWQADFLLNVGMGQALGSKQNDTVNPGQDSISGRGERFKTYGNVMAARLVYGEGVAAVFGEQQGESQGS